MFAGINVFWACNLDSFKPELQGSGQHDSENDSKHIYAHESKLF